MSQEGAAHEATQSRRGQHEHEVGGDSDSGHAESDDHGRFHRDFLMGFVGMTAEDRRNRALTIGIDYNHWITTRFGIGAGVEWAFGDLDFTVFTVPLSYRFGEWKIFAGPGWEVTEGDDIPQPPGARSGGGPEPGGTEILVRAGVEYAFPVGRYEVAPKLMVDFIDGDEVLVLGVAFGRGY